MTKNEYNLKTNRLEELLGLFTMSGQLSKKLHFELNQISNEIADYEENKFPFEPSTLKEINQLKLYHSLNNL